MRAFEVDCYVDTFDKFLTTIIFEVQLVW